MELGITLFLTDQSVDPAWLAKEVESRGFSSLYFPEHTHIPTSRLTPPPTGEKVLPEAYKRTLDPYIALAVCSAVTSRIRLGTGISVLAQHEPIALGKTIATLDLLSRGRFDLGIGFGWNEDEMANHGIEMADRRAVVREHVLAMKELWQNDRATFTGEFVSFAESWAWPKPARKGGPSIFLGGAAGPKLIAHLVEYCDGWMPVGGSGIAEALPRLKDALEAADRLISDFEVVPFGTLPDKAKLDHYHELGIEHVVLRLDDGSQDQVSSQLDSHAQFLAPN